jgi:hypothetical protein
MSSGAPANVAGRLSVIDRFLPVWIFLTMALGVGMGYLFPEIATVFDVLRIDTVSLPIAIGLLWMMYPVLTKVRYEELSKIAQAWKMFGVSIIDVRRLHHPELAHRSDNHVRPCLDVPSRLSSVPRGIDNHRTGAVHRHGAYLEPAGGRR